MAIRANNIGQILKAQGDLAGALRYMDRALRIFEKAFGPENPSTQTVRRNLTILRSQIKGP